MANWFRRKTAQECELELLGTFRQPPENFASPPGVLLSDEIERHVGAYGLIHGFLKDQLKPAAYELRVGDAASVGGVTHSLSSRVGQNELRIEPFDVAIIQTLERLNMPKNLIARWNIRVHWAYQGLLWVGGPQVDPGYKGLLFCPLYNLSDKPVTLRHGDAIAVIDFIATTKPTIESKPYPKQRRHVLGDYNPSLQSALATEARDKIAIFDARLSQVQARVDQYTAITFAALAILVAALAALVGRAPQFDLLSGAFVVAALAVGVEVWCIYLLRAEAQALTFTLKSVSAAKQGWKASPLVMLGVVLIAAFVGFGALNYFVFSEPIGRHIDRIQAQSDKSAADLRDAQGQLSAIRRKMKI